MSDQPTSRAEPLEALSRVKEAEAEAGRTVRAAREKESVQILEELQEEIRKLRDRHLSEAKAQADRRTRERIREAEDEARKIQDAAEAEAEKLRSSAASLVPDAVAKTAAKIAEIIQDRPL
jgi:vacuolar-type H+-ATPase subunit H